MGSIASGLIREERSLFARLSLDWCISSGAQIPFFLGGCWAACEILVPRREF